MDVELPTRTRNALAPGELFDSPHNANFGSGKQTNNAITGGSHHQLFNAENLYYTEHRRAETPPFPTHNVPFLRDPVFVHRSELDDVQRKLIAPGTRVALVGLGGVGKSQLAIEHCYRVRESSPDTWVFWVHAGSAARFDQDIRNIARVARIPGRDIKDVDIFDLVPDWLSDERKSWLIVLDNADGADFLFEPRSTTGASGLANNTAGGRHRLACIPVCSHGSVLVTTRSRAVATRITDSISFIDLKADGGHAIALLGKKLEQQEDHASMTELVSALDHIALAVSQAAAYINRHAPRCSIRAYMDKLEKSEKSRSGLLSSSLKELRRDADANDSILLTWQISFEHIHATRRSAADLLSLLSFFDHQGIPEFLARGKGVIGDKTTGGGAENDVSDASSVVSAGEAFEEDVLTLREYSFISMARDGSSFEMHRLVQLATQMWLRKTKHYHAWESQSLEILDASFPRPDYEKWTKCRTLYPHTRLLLSKRVEQQDTSLKLSSILYKVAWFAWTQGSYIEAEAAARRSMDVRESVLGGADEQTLSSIAMLALVLRYQGKIEAAEEMNRRALEGREKVLGTLHPDTLTSVWCLASLLEAEGQYDTALTLYGRASLGFAEALGPVHPNTIWCESELSSLQRRMLSDDQVT